LVLGLGQIEGAGEIPLADAVPFLGIEGASEAFKKAVCAVQVLHVHVKKLTNEKTEEKTEWLPLGTGFLVKGEPNIVLAITCKHIVQFASKLQKTIYIGLDTEKGYIRFPCNVKYEDPVQDIAILAPQVDQKEDFRFRSLYIDKELFDDDSSLVEGRSVIIPGYPLGLGIEDEQNHPVIRFGIVAQFTGKDYFLLDGIASHGNSGSPVFSLKANKNKLIGMVIFYQSDTINLFDEKSELKASLPYNAGLTRCITMKTILKAIENASY
jgi:hypothetical protein